MKLQLTEIPHTEIVHYARGGDASSNEPELLVTSHSRTVAVAGKEKRYSFALPAKGCRFLFSGMRLARRAMRLDKCNVMPVDPRGSALIAIRQGMVYRVECDSDPVVAPALRLRQCRNILHQSMAIAPSGNVYFGEYGANPNRAAVPVYRSADAGRSWQVAYEFPAKSAKHVHCCAWDPYEEKLWVTSGDAEGECRILCANESFSEIESIGRGEQQFRSCHFLFRDDAVFWIMDSPLETSHLIRLDRRTRRIERLRPFPGPVWYVKDLTDGWCLAATAHEPGPGVQTRFAHLFASRNPADWIEIARYEKDAWPAVLFKAGVIGFADGPQTSGCFFLFGEALRGMDGKAFRGRLHDDGSES
ncbi:MAG: hypothetical protein IT426_17255 [Pirellulales bacterium]|nr:hypothetical protein [Pirellulales bacterium]